MLGNDVIMPLLGKLRTFKLVDPPQNLFTCEDDAIRWVPLVMDNHGLHQRPKLKPISEFSDTLLEEPHQNLGLVFDNGLTIDIAEFQLQITRLLVIPSRVFRIKKLVEIHALVVVYIKQLDIARA